EAIPGVRSDLRNRLSARNCLGSIDGLNQISADRLEKCAPSGERAVLEPPLSAANNAYCHDLRSQTVA
ncbi:MAG: hypothetical protein LJE67_07125, partial [Salaquimonas sp.]|nr:hypothetical protein [Salaquimonas sp.]